MLYYFVGRRSPRPMVILQMTSVQPILKGTSSHVNVILDFRKFFEICKKELGFVSCFLRVLFNKSMETLNFKSTYNKLSRRHTLLVCISNLKKNICLIRITSRHDV